MSNESQENMHFLDYWRVVRSRKEIVIAVTLLIVLTGILLTYSMPEVFASSVIIQVEQESLDMDPFGRQIVQRDPLFLRTQFEIIQSGPIIEEVVRRCRLDEKLGSVFGYDSLPSDKKVEKTARYLSKRMKVQHYRDTNLIQIRMFLSEPKESVQDVVADTVNTIADVYRDQSISRSREVTEKALAALYESLKEQEQTVTTAEEAMEAIRRKHKIMLFGGSTDTSITKLRLRWLDERLISARLELEDKKSRYDKLLSLSPEERLNAGPYLVNDQALAALVASKRKAEVDLSKLEESGFGKNHPDVVSSKATISELNMKIEDALKGLEAGVQADYAAAKAKLDALEKMTQETQNRDIDAESSEYREFEKAAQELAHARKVYDSLESKYLEEKIKLRIPRTTVKIIEPAKAPGKTEPVSPDFVMNIVLSIILGLGSGMGLAFFIEYLDTSVKTIEEIERSMGISVLGIIPQKVKPFVDESADSAYAEAYRVLRTNIQFSKRVKGAKTLCFTSGSVGEGKSLTLFNLGYVCAQLGDRTLIVDTDLHRPKQHKMLGVSNSVGLANVLVGEVKLEDTIVSTKVPNLSFLASGKLGSGVHGLLDTSIMRDIIRELREAYDLVLFDSPPVIGVSDSSALIREMDGVLLVIQHRKYPRAVSNRAKAMIDNLGGNLVGVVLNNINISRDYSYYYYQYHYYAYPQRSKVGRKK